jgi:hypothetical protein
LSQIQFTKSTCEERNNEGRSTEFSTKLPSYLTVCAVRADAAFRPAVRLNVLVASVWRAFESRDVM